MIYHIVVQGKELQKDGGAIHSFNYEIQAPNPEVAKELAKLSFQKDFVLNDISFHKISQMLEFEVY